MAGVSSGLCSGTEPGRVSVVTLEAARIAQLLPHGRQNQIARMRLLPGCSESDNSGRVCRQADYRIIPSFPLRLG
jgi:hypothetical protein